MIPFAVMRGRIPNVMRSKNLLKRNQQLMYISLLRKTVEQFHQSPSNRMNQVLPLHHKLGVELQQSMGTIQL